MSDFLTKDQINKFLASDRYLFVKKLMQELKDWWWLIGGIGVVIYFTCKKVLKKDDLPDELQQEKQKTKEQKIYEKNEKWDRIRHIILTKIYSGTCTTCEEVEEIIGNSLEPLEKELFIDNLRGTCIEEGSSPLALSDNGKRRLHGHNTQYGPLKG